MGKWKQMILKHFIIENLWTFKKNVFIFIITVAQ